MHNPIEAVYQGELRVWEPVSVGGSDSVLREVTDFGMGKMATVSACLGMNRYIVLSESIDHTNPAQVDWPRMIGELFSSGDVVEAQ